MNTSISAIDLLTLALASWSVVVIWIDGEIFEPFRKPLVNAANYYNPAYHRPWHAIWWAKLLTCELCLTVHVSVPMAAALAVAYLLPRGMEAYALACKMPLYLLAAVRLSGLLQELFPGPLLDVEDHGESYEPSSSFSSAAYAETDGPISQYRPNPPSAK